MVFTGGLYRWSLADHALQVHRQWRDRKGIMRRDHTHDRLLLRIQEGDRRALATKPATAANAVNVVLLVLKGRQIEVEDYAYTLHIDAAG